MSLIKWPGGKSKEFTYIEKAIPAFDRYIEPFFGSGAIFFKIKPSNALINDKSVDLMDFYRLIQQNSSEFKGYLYLYNYCWDSLMDLIKGNSNVLLSIYHRYRNEKNDTFLSDELTSFLEKITPELKQLLPEEIIIDYPGLFKEISRTSLDKYTRTQKNELKLQQQLSVQDLQDNILTGYMSGLYMHFRNLYNKIHLDSYGNTIPVTLEHKIANFYFIREFCYGSMFRYNSNGEFNIPYGGISYNSKNFKLKLEKIFQQETLELFKNTQIYSDDFESFLGRIQLTFSDFIFLDPPYDTDFSSYEGNEFNENDQVRLAYTLTKIPAKFILIIKKTDFILSLYRDLNGIHIVDFDKQYAYNVRSRNNRDTNHLIISNFSV